jgi:ABC-2 type transport system ATP-binding protein
MPRSVDAPPDAIERPAAEPPAAERASEPPAEPAPAEPGEPDEPAIIEMEGVSREFDDRLVVRDVSIRLLPGSILGVIGPSGAGKTTTIRMLTGAVKPSRGSVRVLGEDPEGFSRRARERIGYMPQLFSLYPDLSAAENVDFVASLYGLLWPRRRRRVREVLQIVELIDARRRRASALSGGMQRRLELACALVHEPMLLILDEPTAGLDPLLRARIWTELHRLRDAGRTLIVTTQFVHEAEECDAVALLNDGRMIAMAEPDQLRRLATGGDVVDVEVDRMFDWSALEELEGVVAIRQSGPRTLRIVVEDAGRGTPAIMEAINSAGIDVVSAREEQPSFDEVFAALIGRDRAATDAGAGVEGSPETDDQNDREAAA